MSQRRLPALDGLRGVAAVVVVVYHTLRLNDGFRSGMYRFTTDNWWDWLMTLTPLRVFFDGQLAVWVFFVLSGYVLSRRQWQGHKTRWGSFYARRAVRLYLPVIASAFWAVALLSIRQQINGDTNGMVSLEKVDSSASLLIHNMALLTLTRAPLNGVWWSMRWEVWFSILVLPALAVLGWLGCGAQRRFQWAPAIFGLLCLLVIAVLPHYAENWGSSYLWSRVLLYMPMFGVGMTIAAYEPAFSRSRLLKNQHVGWWTLIIGLALLGIQGPIGWMRVEGIISGVHSHGLANVSSVIGAAMLIAVFVGWPTGVHALSTKPLAWVGARSYSLYLVHIPLLHFVTDLFNRSTAPVWYVAAILAASLAVSAVFYRWVEAPSTRLAGRIGRRQIVEPAAKSPDNRAYAEVS